MTWNYLSMNLELRATNEARNLTPNPFPLGKVNRIERTALRQRQNRESRAENARCIRTLTFILSLAGRGDRKSELRHLGDSDPHPPFADERRPLPDRARLYSRSSLRSEVNESERPY